MKSVIIFGIIFAEHFVIMCHYKIMKKQNCIQFSLLFPQPIFYLHNLDVFCMCFDIKPLLLIFQISYLKVTFI